MPYLNPDLGGFTPTAPRYLRGSAEVVLNEKLIPGSDYALAVEQSKRQEAEAVALSLKQSMERDAAQASGSSHATRF
jgi:hypothetical protein